MDDNKADSQTPTNIPEDQEPVFSHEEIKKESFKDIASNKDLPEDKKEEPKTEEPKKEEEVEIDPEKMAEEIAEKVEKKLATKQTPQQTQETKAEAKDKYEEFFEKIKAEKGREPNWREVAKFIEDQTRESIKHEQEEAQRIEKEQKEVEEKANEELTKRLNAQVDEELDELYKNGDLTPIKDKNNPNDQGVIERKALFQAMLETNEKRAAQGLPPILSVSRIFYGGYYTKPNAQPAGEDAPISMGKGSMGTGEGEQEIDYMKDIKRPWSSFRIPKL